MAKLPLISKLGAAKKALQAAAQSDPPQTKALGSVARLFAVMLVLTLVARGTAAAAMPQVTLSTPYSAEIVTRYTVPAAVAVQDGIPVQCPAGLLVSEVYVGNGESVQAGKPLARLNVQQLELALGEARATLRQMQVAYAQGSKAVSADPFDTQQAQQKLQRAYDQTHQAYTEGKELLQQSEDARDAAESALNALLRTLPATPESAAYADKLEQARAALAAAEEGVKSAEKQAQALNDSALDAAQNIEDSRNSALHSYDKQTETACEQTAANRAEAGVTLAKIAQKQAEIEALQAVSDAGGLLLAPYSGTVTRIDLAAGGITPAVAALLADVSAKSTLQFVLEKDAAALATVGSAVHITQNKIEADAAITSLSVPDEDGAVTATVRLSDGGWKAGAAQVEIKLSAGRYDQCLPATAINTDSSGDFVWRIEQRSTVLGMQNLLVRVPVTVESSGSGITAVSGALGAQERVVSGSDKPLSVGARVRVAQ